MSGFSIATGVSKYKSEKTSLNIGISIYYLSTIDNTPPPSKDKQEIEIAIYPSITLERRF